MKYCLAAKVGTPTSGASNFAFTLEQNVWQLKNALNYDRLLELKWLRSIMMMIMVMMLMIVMSTITILTTPTG